MELCTLGTERHESLPVAVNELMNLDNVQLMNLVSIQLMNIGTGNDFESFAAAFSDVVKHVEMWPVSSKEESFRSRDKKDSPVVHPVCGLLPGTVAV